MTAAATAAFGAVIVVVTVPAAAFAFVVMVVTVAVSAAAFAIAMVVPVPAGAALSVDVSMRDFFGGGGADIDDFDCKLEIDSGEGVVGVEGDFVSVNFNDANNHRALGAVGLKLDALFNLGIGGKLAALGRDGLLRITLPVAFGRRDEDILRAVDLPAFES